MDTPYFALFAIPNRLNAKTTREGGFLEHYVQNSGSYPAEILLCTNVRLLNRPILII